VGGGCTVGRIVEGRHCTSRCDCDGDGGVVVVVVGKRVTEESENGEPEKGREMGWGEGVILCCVVMLVRPLLIDYSQSQFPVPSPRSS